MRSLPTRSVPPKVEERGYRTTEPRHVRGFRSHLPHAVLDGASGTIVDIVQSIDYVVNARFRAERASSSALLSSLGLVERFICSVSSSSSPSSSS